MARLAILIGVLLLAFGWIKTVGGMRKTRHRGVAGVEWMFTLTIEAYNLTGIRKLAWETG